MAETIKLNYLTKIEGHAKLAIKIDKGRVKDVNLQVFEGARFFEGLIEGMQVKRAPVITSRICGVCSQAHIIASYQAIETAFDIRVTKQTKQMRKLLLYSSIVQSHVLHAFLMCLPDYYNIKTAVDFARKHASTVKLALKIKSLSGRILEMIGGREVHSVTCRVGGFKIFPSQQALDCLLQLLKKEVKHISSEFGRLFPKLQNPEFESNTEFVALQKNKIKTSSGNSFDIEQYRDMLDFYIKKNSSSKFITLDDKKLMTSALSRLNINKKSMNPLASAFLARLNLKLPSNNPFDNVQCQAVEIIHYLEECITILENMKIRHQEKIQFKAKGDVKGLSAVEVPRGVLFHGYRIKDGQVKRCRIITPTTQNIQSIEDDIKAFLPMLMHLKKEEIIFNLERLVRAYDPCISCSTHFLKVEGL